jgi:hypothetical protein
MKDWLCSQPGCGKHHSDHLREEAERRVIAARGSSDVPGFEACVDAEIEVIRQERGEK